jgi:lysophospholipase L1-like esterase
MQYDCYFVELQSVFDEACEIADCKYWLWDGVHPTTAGHQLIARRWKECVKEKLESR